jgi:hypothetical protein
VSANSADGRDSTLWRCYQLDFQNIVISFWQVLAVVSVSAKLKPAPFELDLRHGPGLERLPPLPDGTNRANNMPFLDGLDGRAHDDSCLL